MPSVAEIVDATIKDNKVVIFSKSYCPYCSKAKKVFRENFADVDVKVLELDEIDNGVSIQNYLAEKTSQRTVPSVWVGEQFIGGGDDTAAALKSGKLAGLLKG